LKPAAGTLAVALMLACAGLYPAAANAQDDQATQREMQRSSMERDRQSDAFSLQLQQQQLELLAPPRSLGELQDLHATQRRDFDRLLEEQRTASRGADSVSWGPRLDTGPQMERERRMALDKARRESEAR